MLTQKRLGAAEIAGDRDPTAELLAAILRGRASRMQQVSLRRNACIAQGRVGWVQEERKFCGLRVRESLT
eukprot:6031000-Pleurochrysis_carterae.AAC.1